MCIILRDKTVQTHAQKASEFSLKSDQGKYDVECLILVHFSVKHLTLKAQSESGCSVDLENSKRVST